MENKIKFRGRKTFGKWLYGDLLRWYGNTSIISLRKKESDLLNMFGSKLVKGAVIPDTVGQFIGKLDVNCKEIYEGDILIGNGISPKIVQFRNEKGAFCIANISDLENSDCMDIWKCPDERWWKEKEILVMGNIYDDKDFISSYQNTLLAKKEQLNSAYNNLSNSIKESCFNRLFAMFNGVRNWFNRWLKK